MPPKSKRTWVKRIYKLYLKTKNRELKMIWTKLSDGHLIDFELKKEKLHGLFKEYYREWPTWEGVPYLHYEENAKVFLEGTYNLGKKEGIWIEFFENGKPRYIIPYKNGKLEGIWREFFENGGVRREVSYVKGKKEGECLSFYENGNLMLRQMYCVGHVYPVNTTTFYENGNLHSKNEHVFKDGYWVSDGLWIAFDEFGNISRKAVYQDGKRIL